MKKWYAKYYKNPTKWPRMDLHMTFDFAILKLEIDKCMKTKKTLKHWPIPNTQNSLKTSLLNTIWSYRVIIDPTLIVDHVWPNFANFDYSFFTIWPSNWCHTSPTPISHHILPIQWSDLGFESRALWTCVVPTHLEILINHVLLIQLFDWAQNSSKPIFYPTLSIQWSNFKFDYGTRCTHVISAYNETSITKNIKYSTN